MSTQLNSVDPMPADDLMPAGKREWTPPPAGLRLIEAARALAPTLAERSAEVDRQRSVHPETIAAFRDAGLLRTLKPARYDGYQLDPWTNAHIALELGTGCPSSAWVFSLLSEHNWFIAMYPLEAQEEVWGADQTACAAGSLRPDRTRAGARASGGAVRLSGRFPFMSGSDHVSWMLLGAYLDRADGSEPTRSLFLVPKSEMTMIDDWHVLGMRGTGSRSYVADDVLVPEHRVMAYADLWNARGAGVSMYPDWPLVQTPKSAVSAYVTSAPAIGVAAGAIEAFLAVVEAKPVLASSPITAMKFSEAAAELFASKLLMDADLRDQMRYIDAGEPTPPALLARCKRNSSYVGVLAWRCVERLHGAAGAQYGGFEGAPLERAVRDAKMATMQFGLQWETHAPGFANWAFGHAEALSEREQRYS